jgi:acyl dehydratase
VEQGRTALHDTTVGTELPQIVRVIRQPVLRSRTWGGRNAIHWDPEVARQRGFPGPIATGQLLTAYLQEMCVQFFGAHFFGQTSFECRYVRPAFLDDEIATGGVVTDRIEEDEGIRLRADVWCENQRGERVTVGVVECVVGGG